MVYHLHGYSFYVVGARQFERSMSLKEVKTLDARGQLFSRNLKCAPLKDTVVVPKFGAVALRFKANNPGKFCLSPASFNRCSYFIVVNQRQIENIIVCELLATENRVSRENSIDI